MLPKIVATLAITQAEIPGLLASYRVTAYPVIVRTERQQLGGGFGDHSRHPHTWTVLLQVDGQWARVESVRGAWSFTTSGHRIGSLMSDRQALRRICVGPPPMAIMRTLIDRPGSYRQPRRRTPRPSRTLRPFVLARTTDSRIVPLGSIRIRPR